MNIRLKFEILTFLAAPETHFASIPMLGEGRLTQHLWVRPLWFSTLQLLFGANMFKSTLNCLSSIVHCHILMEALRYPSYYSATKASTTQSARSGKITNK